MIARPATPLLTLLAAAALLMGAAAKPKPSAHPAKPAAAAGIALDTSNPANLAQILGSAGAKTQIAQKEGDAVLMTVTSTVANFSVQFAECNAQGRACKAALLDSVAGGAPTLAQMNGFNQASAMCRGYQDKSGKPHVTMALLLFPDDTRLHATTALAAWQGCLADFANFAKDPVAWLASAP